MPGSEGLRPRFVAIKKVWLHGETAVKAIIPQETEFDIFTDIAFPGGIMNDWFIRTWNQTNQQLDQNKVPKEWGLSARLFVKGVSHVYEDGQGQQLKAALPNTGKIQMFIGTTWHHLS